MMMMMERRIRLAWLATSMAIPFVALADGRDESLAACRAEGDDARRLACYDRVMEQDARGPPAAAAAPAAAAPAAVPAAPATPAAPELSAEERFGRRGAMTRADTERQEKESRDLGMLVATVTDIKTRSDGLMTFTLDNGQVWAQIRPDSLFRLRAGDPVKIQPGAMNSFLLSGPSKRSTRVARLK